MWKQQFVRSAESFWNGKFWLLNDAAAFAYKTGTGLTLYPNVWCRFKLLAFDSPAAFLNHTIDVVRLHPSENWFGSHSTLYDSKDTALVSKGITSTNKSVMQRAHAHEIGHLLGLDHVDVGKPHCPATGNTNAAACYGVADNDMVSVMGAGMQLRLTHAYPWRECLRYLTAQNKAQQSLALLAPLPSLLTVSIAQILTPLAVWTTTSVWPAATKRHYPRTAAEVSFGKQLVVRPVRPH